MKSSTSIVSRGTMEKSGLLEGRLRFTYQDRESKRRFFFVLARARAHVCMYVLAYWGMKTGWLLGDKNAPLLKLS
jgi:hypothetical protein